MAWSSIAGLIFLGIIIVLLIEDIVVGLKKNVKRKKNVEATV
jgi:hypothetical protein